MKIIATITACLVLASYTSHAADVEARLLRFSGQVPSLPALVRLMDTGAIGNFLVLSTALKADRSFDYSAVKPDTYPTEFDADSKPTATSSRDAGVTFSGHAKEVGGGYALDLAFRLVERADTILYPTTTGGTVAQPVFAEKTVQSQVVLQPGEWSLVPVPGGTDKQSEHCVLLVRMR